MKVRKVAPNVDPNALLAGAQFIDAYRVAVDGGALDAREAAVKMFTRGPRWIDALVNLRNLGMAVLGVTMALVPGLYRVLMAGASGQKK